MFEKIKLLFKNNREFRPGVFIVVYKIENNKPRYLILKRKLHWIGWEFTKGGQEKGESLMQTIKRELKEETNLKPLKIQGYNKSGRYIYDKQTNHDRKFIGQSYILYSAKVKDGKVKIDKLEHSGYRWVDFKTAMKMLTWPNQRGCLRIVDERIKFK